MDANATYRSEPSRSSRPADPQKGFCGNLTACHCEESAVPYNSGLRVGTSPEKRGATIVRAGAGKSYCPKSGTGLAGSRKSARSPVSDVVAQCSALRELTPRAERQLINPGGVEAVRQRIVGRRPLPRLRIELVDDRRPVHRIRVGVCGVQARTLGKPPRSLESADGWQVLSAREQNRRQACQGDYLPNHAGMPPLH